MKTLLFILAVACVVVVSWGYSLTYQHRPLPPTDLHVVQEPPK